MIAEQNIESVLYSQSNSPDVLVRLGVRVQIPAEGQSAGLYDVGVEYRLMPLEPAEWHFTLTDQMSNGVHNGIAAVGAPLPNGGIRVFITYPTLYPMPLSDPPESEVERYSELLNRAVAGAVEVLWRGIISFDPGYNSHAKPE